MMMGSGAPAARPGLLSLHTLVLIRWIAVTGQVTTVLVVGFVLEVALPKAVLFAIIAALALFNLAMMRLPRRRRLGDLEAAGMLGVDLLQLAAMLYFTGGLSNPFAVLLLAPAAVAATVLSRRAVVMLTGLALLSFGGLAMAYQPLLLADGPLALPGLYRAGIWVGLTSACLFIVAYTARVTEEARQMQDAMLAMQTALEREQRVSAVGALAAAAAHELGSPLSTITVIAKEMARDLPADSPLAEDVALLQSQSARCRDILAQLSRAPTPDEGGPFGPAPLATLVEQIIAPYRRPGIALTIDAEAALRTDPLVRRSPELQHGLANILQNAMQFAAHRVEVGIVGREDRITLSVSDDGPGFPPALLDKLGEPYVSGRAAGTDHLGLGLFIARTLLARTGAEIGFGNRPDQRGAQVMVSWTKAALEQYQDQR